ncbi:unnamed protein product [marine sediment metagenome]|uniref:Uncharacterized protein n=1 Tax=marine sediment metagenome TaxID=412755 RepID=X1E952_9ZZZZ
MARRRKKQGRRKRKVSLFAVGGAVAALAYLWSAYAAGGTFQDKGNRMFSSLTGIDLFNKSFNIWDAQAGIALAGGAGASMVAAKTGLNRYLNIPFFKL